MTSALKLLSVTSGRLPGTCRLLVVVSYFKKYSTPAGEDASLPAAKAHGGHSPDRLGDYPACHLRRSDAAVAEGDRDLDDSKARPDGAPGELDLEGIAARIDRLRLDRLQDPAADRPEPAGEVANRGSEDRPGVDAAEAADRPPPWPPVCDLTVVDVARADRHVRALDAFEQSRKIGGIVGEIRVHLDDDLGSRGERLANPGDVGGPEALLRRAMEHRRA